MPYDLKITGLANRDELKRESAKDHRLYKFTLSKAPDNFWVLLLQQAGRGFPDVTISGNAGSTELWVSAPASVSVQKVLDDTKRAVAQANADATASDKQLGLSDGKRAASPAAQQDTLAKELDELDFSVSPSSGDGADAVGSAQKDLAAFDEQLKASEQVSSTKAEPVEDTRHAEGLESGSPPSDEG